MYVVLVPYRYPSSPVAIQCHSLYPIVTHCYPLKFIITCNDLSSVTRYYSLSYVVTRRHLFSPVTTPLGELTHAYAYYCNPFFMNYMPIKFQPSIFIKKIEKVGSFGPPQEPLHSPMSSGLIDAVSERLGGGEGCIKSVSVVPAREDANWKSKPP